MNTLALNYEVALRCAFDLEAFIHGILREKKIDQGHFEFSFVTPETLLTLNKKFFNKTTQTDIISFNLGQPEAIIGDVYICPETARDQAQTYRHTFDDEIKTLLIHGILHLLNYQDTTPETQRHMFAEQNRLLDISA